MNISGKKIHVSAMEPLLPDTPGNPALIDLATELIAKASALKNILNPAVTTSISDLVRSMNCYYSNLIEGHNTHPRDIEKALHDDLSKNAHKRALQLEARSHIHVQEIIDHDETNFSVSHDYICWLHQAFYEKLPNELLIVTNPDTNESCKVRPGKLREQWVQVGMHIAPGPNDLPEFLTRFCNVYSNNALTKIQKVIAVAASHHRLLWIHPFLDGNGRVARLFAHAFLRDLDVGSGLWSIARGLARDNKTYKEVLSNADNARLGDLDGRGVLSEKYLVEFCEFFLSSCIDQITYMERLIQPAALSQRIFLYVEDQQRLGNLPNGCFPLLRETLLRGAVGRGEAASITGYRERQARTILNALLERNLLISDTPRGPVRLNFPLEAIEHWLPNLYP